MWMPNGGRLGRGALCLAAGTWLACAPSAAQSPSAPVAARATGELITLERRPCYGTCPVYRMRVFDTGRVEFEGIRHVVQIGVVVDSVPRARFDQLRRAFAALPYASLARRYAYGEPACPLYAADAVTVVTSIEVDGRVTSVEHDHGCSGVPSALTALEDLIDETVASWRWTTGRQP
jgi:hypothetical protein